MLLRCNPNDEARYHHKATVDHGKVAGKDGCRCRNSPLSELFASWCRLRAHQVKWFGWDTKSNTWEPLDMIADFKEREMRPSMPVQNEKCVVMPYSLVRVGSM